MKIFKLTSKLWVPSPLPEVFQFFSDAANLERLTPKWLNFQLMTHTPIPMAVGTRIDYRLRLRKIPITWQSEISVWEPPHRFVDTQLRGPYRLWVHEHRFCEEDEKTLVEDRVQYAVPGGRLANIFVARDLRLIFAYRRTQMQKLFGVVPGQDVSS